MPAIQLGYGRGTIKFEYDSARFAILTSPESNRSRLSDAEISAALDTPIDCRPLDEVIEPDQTVLMVTSDATRATGSAHIINVLIRRLIEHGVAPADMAIIFATGIHRPVLPDEKVELLTSFIAQRIRTIDHNAHDKSSLIEIGSNAEGLPIEVNRALKEFDKVIVTGGISFHYFAGFTGGRKAICPGLASADTIRATHMLALDFARGGRRLGVGPGALIGNAVNEECEHVTSLIEPAFSINTIVTDRGEPENIFVGHWRTAHRRGCETYTADHSVTTPEKREVVVVSCGGSPYDINMIQAHKALDMAAQACVPGGTIVLVAECSDGLGRSDFLQWFGEPDSRSLENRLRAGYEVNGQTAWALLTKTETFRVQIVTNLDDVTVKQMRMVPAQSLEEAMADVPRHAMGFIMPHGAAFLPVVKQSC